MVRKNARKGQQALEYLVTYGWAFVVVILTVGLFAYFGILNPERYIPDRCELGVQLPCVDYVLQAETTPNGIVLIRVQNAFTVPVDIVNISTAAGGGRACNFQSGASPSCNDITGSEPIVSNLAPGNTSGAIALDLTGTQYTLVDRDKTLVPIALTFTRSGGTGREHTIIGEVFATVQTAN